MSVPQTADIVIAGGGVIGASTAYHLAKAGANNVVLLERADLFGTESTAKCAGGVRAHFDTEINCRMSQLSLPAFERFEAETGYSADYRKIGYLFVLNKEKDLAAFRKQMDMHLALGIRTEWLSGDDVRKLLPMMNFEDALGALFGPDDGLADNGAVVQGYVSAASKLGVRCLTGVDVTGVETAGGKVVAVQTSQGRIETRLLVNTAGAWGREVGRMAGLEIPIEPVKRQLFTTAPTPEIPADFTFVIEFGTGLYFHREGPGLLSGMSRVDQPPSYDQTVDEDWELNHLETAAFRLPLMERTGIARRWAGLYEITPDHHPIIGPVEGLEGFYMNAGFSGHGFMHSPAAGLLAAEDILTGTTPTLDISMLRLERYTKGEALHEYNVF
ncbi:MAG: FAD-binding oxidoreductase [Candidatus Aminicenantes bacterium]|nr:FAD-binding oxidoreductase [Candidatus Aminicenantes bacterium]